jgi:hypothetical protein
VLLTAQEPDVARSESPPNQAHLQVVCEEVDPLGGPRCQAGLEGLGADANEADRGAAWQRANLLRDGPVWGGCVAAETLVEFQ